MDLISVIIGAVIGFPAGALGSLIMWKWIGPGIVAKHGSEQLFKGIENINKNPNSKEAKALKDVAVILVKPIEAKIETKIGSITEGFEGKIDEKLKLAKAELFEAIMDPQDQEMNDLAASLFMRLMAITADPEIKKIIQGKLNGYLKGIKPGLINEFVEELEKRYPILKQAGEGELLDEDMFDNFGPVGGMFKQMMKGGRK